MHRPHQTGRTPQCLASTNCRTMRHCNCRQNGRSVRRSLVLTASGYSIGALSRKTDLPISIAKITMSVVVTGLLCQGYGTPFILISTTRSCETVLPKFGMRLRLPADDKTINYYVRGPWENYPDPGASAPCPNIRLMATSLTTTPSS